MAQIVETLSALFFGIYTLSAPQVSILLGCAVFKVLLIALLGYPDLDKGKFMKRWSCGLILYMEELRLHIFAVK